MVNAARLLGPSLAGVLIATVGEGWCFMIDAISYLAVIASLLMMSITPRTSTTLRGSNILQQLREGWRYVSGFSPIRNILLLLGFVSLVGMPYTVLMPIFANDVLKGGPNTLGLLMASSGVGALLGALFLASRRTVLGLGKLIPLAAGIFGAGLIAFSFSHVMWLSIVLMLATGLGFMANGCQQHSVTNNYGRGQARASYEFLHDGVYGDRSIWQSSRRNCRGKIRSPKNFDVWGHRLHHRGVDFLLFAAGS